jgi:tetratricopeptide (TPR) repeat protein
MPFGTKPDASGRLVQFDAVYALLIAPAINRAGMRAIRADEEKGGGIIHKPMFERLLLCEFAVADLTTANANVFYELGVRHASRPGSTVLLFAEEARLPFDVATLRAMPYAVSAVGEPAQVERDCAKLAGMLEQARYHRKDSPLFELLDGLEGARIPHTRTDTFREEVEYSAQVRDRLASARKHGADAVAAVEESLGRVEDVEAGVAVDLLLSYRDVKAYPHMIALVQRMAPPVRDSVLVQEQLGFALNRAGRTEEAEDVLTELIARRGPSSETCGLLGRVLKDRWDVAAKKGDLIAARGLLRCAIDAYLKGFEADPRDAFPGVNAVTLMELRDPPDVRRIALTPVVRYAVERKIAMGRPDYWDFATRLELAVLAQASEEAAEALADAVAAKPKPWEFETTARNLELIRTARARRGLVVQWADLAQKELEARASGAV